MWGLLLTAPPRRHCRVSAAECLMTQREGKVKKKNSNSGTTCYFFLKKKTINRRRFEKGCFFPPPQFHFSSRQWPWMRRRLSFCPSCCCPALISAASSAARQRTLARLTLPRATQRQTGRVRIDSPFGCSDLRRASLGQTRQIAREQRSRAVTHGRLSDDELSEKPRPPCELASGRTNGSVSSSRRPFAVPSHSRGEVAKNGR